MHCVCIPVELLSPICDYNMRCRKLSYCHLFRFVHMGIECEQQQQKPAVEEEEKKICQKICLLLAMLNDW